MGIKVNNSRYSDEFLVIASNLNMFHGNGEALLHLDGFASKQKYKYLIAKNPGDHRPIYSVKVIAWYKS